MGNEEQYYYFPTMTKNIMFVRGEKYVIKGKTYILYDFVNNSWSSPITFIDNYKDMNMLKISACDIGIVISLKEKRKRKIQKLKNYGYEI